MAGVAGVVDGIVRSAFRRRIFILILLAPLGAGAIAFLCRRDLPDAEVVVRIAAVLIGSTIIGFVHLRHFWLAFLATIAPLPGVLLVATVTGGDAPMATVAYALGLVVALSAADEIAVRVAENVPPPAAAHAAMQAIGAAALAIVVVAILLALAVGWLERDTAELLMGAASALTALLVVPLAASSLRFAEDFVTSFNRVREREERLMMPLLPVAHARWGASVTGVLFVVCALGYFGVATLALAPSFHKTWLLAVFATMVAAVVAFLLVRDWRRTGAVVLSLVPVVLLTLWVMARLRTPLDAQSFQVLSVSFLTGFSLVLSVAVQAAHYMRGGNDMAVASARAMERKAAMVVTATVACAFVACLTTIALVVPLLFSAAAALLFQPAIAISIEALFPRRETVAARYRLR